MPIIPLFPTEKDQQIESNSMHQNKIQIKLRPQQLSSKQYTQRHNSFRQIRDLG